MRGEMDQTARQQILDRGQMEDDKGEISGSEIWESEI